MTRGQIEVMLMDWGVFRRLGELEREVKLLKAKLEAMQNGLHELKTYRR